MEKADKLDILAIGAHPDDVELGCAGTLLKHIDLGYKVGILDLTRGELGTRGSAEIRDQEAAAAAKVLGITVRENLALIDGFFQNDRECQLAIIRLIRKYRPSIVITNAFYDRHPDHGRASKLTADACFLSGLPKIETELGGAKQEKWRPKAVYHYIQALHMKPDLVVDISPYFEQKMESVLAYRSQFYDPDSKEPQTFISSPEFLDLVRARAIEFGSYIGVKYAEGYCVDRLIGVPDLVALL
ncbi:MAG: bacillithiol biosynthesis deacetylase BshB1 [Chitinophagales bacterium]|nr:bacillithiol biosynthesis deacetylase BshB1 [Chitinophagales bacterium]